MALKIHNVHTRQKFSFAIVKKTPKWAIIKAVLGKNFLAVERINSDIEQTKVVLEHFSVISSQLVQIVSYLL